MLEQYGHGIFVFIKLTKYWLDEFCRSATYRWNYVSNRTFEDVSKWYNIVVARGTTDGTAGDRVKIYVDGDKSLSIRWALLASQAIGTSKAKNLLKSEDVQNTLSVYMFLENT